MTPAYWAWISYINHPHLPRLRWHWSTIRSPVTRSRSILPTKSMGFLGHDYSSSFLHTNGDVIIHISSYEVRPNSEYGGFRLGHLQFGACYANDELGVLSAADEGSSSMSLNSIGSQFGARWTSLAARTLSWPVSVISERVEMVFLSSVSIENDIVVIFFCLCSVPVYHKLWMPSRSTKSFFLLYSIANSTQSMYNFNPKPWNV